MEEVIQYQFFWAAPDNQGVIHLALANGTGASIELDSAQEGMLLLDVLRNEKPVFFNREHGLLSTGFEPVGEGEEAA